MKRSTPQLVRVRELHEDSAILERLARGEMGALGELYDLYAVALLRFVRRAAPHDDAEDIVQATFVRVVGIAGSFDPNASSARPWLFSIAARLMQGRNRSLRRFSAALLGLANHPRSEVANRGAANADFERAVAQLSDAKRIVLLLAEVEGFACEEVASMLQIPVGTVWTRLHHARLELRRFFAEEP